MRGFRDAEDFWSSFIAQYVEAVRDPAWFKSEFGEDHTRGMYRVLHAMQQARQLWCECRFRHDGAPESRPGERMSADFFWYPADTGRWARPVAAIEHQTIDQAPMEDVWRVCQFTAPLRVFIGYARREDEIQGLWNELRNNIHENRLAKVPGSETLVILGDYDPTSVFHAWASGGDGEFRHLSEARVRD